MRSEVGELETVPADLSSTMPKLKAWVWDRAMWGVPVLAFGVMSFLLLAYLSQSAQIVRAQYRIVAVRAEVKELQQESDDLELKACELSSLERVEKIATTRLAMMIPTQRRVIEVSWQKAYEKGHEVAAR